MSHWRHFLELIRFSHTIFALPFALLAALLAWRQTPFQWIDLLGILLCMACARSTAMAFNRLVDREMDAANPRTAMRHLPAGLLSVNAVRLFTTLCAAGFVASTLLFLPNWWPLILSGPVLLFLCGYSYAKRFTRWCHYWLAAALMLSPIATWIAITGTLAPTPLILAVVVFFWVGGFDTLYACQDVEFDRTHGVHSIPARVGVRNALRLAAVSHALAAIALFSLWHFGNLGPIFLAGIVGATVLLIYEHAIVRADDLTRVNVAFFQVNAVVSLGLFIVGAFDVWLAF